MKEKLPLIFSSIALVFSIAAIVITLMFGGVFRSVGSSGTQMQAPSGMSTDGGGQQGGTPPANGSNSTNSSSSTSGA